MCDSCECSSGEFLKAFIRAALDASDASSVIYSIWERLFCENTCWFAAVSSQMIP